MLSIHTMEFRRHAVAFSNRFATVGQFYIIPGRPVSDRRRQLRRSGQKTAVIPRTRGSAPVRATTASTVSMRSDRLPWMRGPAVLASFLRPRGHRLRPPAFADASLRQATLGSAVCRAIPRCGRHDALWLNGCWPVGIALPPAAVPGFLGRLRGKRDPPADAFD